jgi:pyruvate dehydrogenase (quinone)
MKDAALSLLKGDPDRWELLKQGVKTKAQELLPHKDN